MMTEDLNPEIDLESRSASFPSSAQSPSDRSSTPRQPFGWLSALSAFTIAVAALSLAVYVAIFFSGPMPFAAVWEDACMFARYAHNVRTAGVISWDPHGTATYGLTSPFYFLAVVLPLSTAIQSPLLLVSTGSMACGLLAVLVMVSLIWEYVPGTRAIRLAAVALVFASFVQAELGFTSHLVGGMDTFFGVLFLAAYLMLLNWYEGRRGLVSGLIAGAFGGLAYGARPDLVLYPVLMGAALLIMTPARRSRRAAASMLGATVAVILLQMIAVGHYFDSVFPLAFYAKATNLYPGFRRNRFLADYQLFDYVRAYRILFLVIAVDVLSNPRRWWRDTAPMEKALALSTSCYLTYFVFGVVQIMPAFQRFFYPSLPALAFLAALSLARLLGRAPERWRIAALSVGKPLRLVAFAAVVLALTPDIEQAHPISRLLAGQITSFDITSEYKAYWSGYWAGLDQFSTLPSDLVIATTETGHAGAMNMEKMVVDLAGLNTTLFAKHPFSADRLFAHYQPDLIYMPPPAYVGMNRELMLSGKFQNEYLFVPPERLHAGMGIAVWKGSKYFPKMAAILGSLAPKP